MLNRTRRWPLPALAAAALVAGAGAAGGTFALWNGTSGTDQAVIVAGALDISVDDGENPRWYETSPDVDSTPRDIDPEEFLVRQGDTVGAGYEFAIELDGDNMRADLRLDWLRSPDLPEGVSGSYELLDADGEPVLDENGMPVSGDLPDGATSVDLGVLDFDGQARSEGFILSLALDFDDLEDRFGSESEPQVVDLGDFSVGLEQIREGDGFQ
ncbi:hypothetical protein [Nesterenkonia muleiensis]|uniref:hypothetical protein n=1 Tax=Nesterenkonia muleiensis TaxID=2282648 RepID=UPI000E720CA4|nr:hypothetical protein [Nesterenkonia muleiensis]